MSHKTVFQTQSEKELDRILKSRQSVPIFKMDKEINPNTKKKVQTEPTQLLDPNVALTELAKHVKKTNKLEIIIKKTLILMQEYYASLNIRTLLDLLYEILSSFRTPVCQQELLKIYQILEDNKVEQGTLQLFKLKCQTITEIETDDSFEYNAIIKQLTTRISNIKVNEYKSSLNQQFLCDVIEHIITLKQHSTISTIRKQFIQNLTHELKQFFDEEYQKSIDSIVTRFQTDKMKEQIQHQNQIQQSALIQENYLKPNHDVVDYRPLVESNNSLDAWNLKQQGL